MKIILMLMLTMNVFAQDHLKVNVLELTNANAKDEARIKRALELLEEVVNSEEFRKKILNMEYKVGKYLYQGFGQTSHTPEKVLENILLAKENFKGGTDGEIDLFLDMYYEVSSTVGYTSYYDKFVHMNRYFHNDYTPMETAGNLFHEWLHKINYGHSKRHNSYRPHSVPYKLGKLVAEMAAEIESQGDPVLKSFLVKKFEGECSHLR